MHLPLAKRCETIKPNTHWRKACARDCPYNRLGKLRDASQFGQYCALFGVDLDYFDPEKPPDVIRCDACFEARGDEAVY